MKPDGIADTLSEASTAKRRATITRYEHLLAQAVGRKASQKTKERLQGLTSDVSEELRANWGTLCSGGFEGARDGLVGHDGGRRRRPRGSH